MHAIPSRRGTVRHSFSAYPDSWPGSGLLLLRITIGLPLLYWGLYRGIHDLLALRISAIPELATAAASVFVIAGLYTSVAGSFIALVEALIVFHPAFADPPGLSIRVFLAAGSASLAMLGPGAWSVDARRFGRKVFEIGESRRGSSERSPQK